MTVPQQKLQGSDHRCRLAVPSLHVSRTNLSWHWDPDALACWNTVMSYLVSFLEVSPLRIRYCWLQDWRWELGVVKLGVV